MKSAMSEMKLVIVDTSPEKVDAFRKRMSTYSLYGSRAAAFVGSPFTHELPPYFASLIASEDEFPSLSTKEVAKIYEHLRPFSGILCLGETALLKSDGEIQKKGALAFGLEATFNTATHPMIGTGKTTLGPQAFLVFFQPFGIKGSILAPAYQYVFDIAGDDDRADISRSAIDIFFVL